MKVYVTQVYVEPGVNFPFSHIMQGWLADELTSLADPRDEFERKYGSDFNLGVYISAYPKTVENVIKGPTVFKKKRDVEYTVFLPYDAIIEAANGCRVALEFLMDGIRNVFEQTGIDPRKLDLRRSGVIEHICSDAKMLKKPWPTR